MKCRVAAIQMVSTFDVDANLRSAEQQLRAAAEAGVELAVLPENFAVLDSDNLLRWADEEQRNRIFTGFVETMARTLGLWIVAGTIPMRSRRDGTLVDANRVRAASILFAPDGAVFARYDKLHLFDVLVGDAQGQYRESASIEPGDQPLVVATPLAQLGLTVCYDLRFPELYSWLQREGADIITVPSAFTYRTGEAHWEVLLRARAIETQCFIIAPNQGGVHSARRTTWGHTMIIDPWGTVLGCHATGPGLVIADLDLAQLRELRTSMPLQQHKRFSPTFTP